MFLVLSACSTPKPILEIANAKTEIAEAKKFKAPTLAEQELRLAEKNLEKANDALSTGQNLKARWYALKAISDAEYARVKATAATFTNLAEKQQEALVKSQEKREQKKN